MNTLYLQKSLSVNGRNSFRGRKLFDRYKDGSKEIILGHIVLPEHLLPRKSDPQTDRDIISASIYNELAPDIIYLEGGLISSKDYWKVPKEILLDSVNNGSVLIIPDTDINDLNRFKEIYSEIFGFARSYISFNDEENRNPIYASDKNGSPAELTCFPEKMIISDWLKPIYNNVDKIVVSWAMKLGYTESILVSGNYKSTGTLALDNWIDELDPCPFGSVVQIGQGFVVFISAISTYWSETNDGNLNWLYNIGTFLHNEARFNVNRSASHYFSKQSLFLSHRSTDKKIVDIVAQIIKRNGLGIWYDKDKLLPSDSLTKKIDEGLSQMTHFILFWSKSCLESAWVEREMNVAIHQLIEAKKPIIIVRLDQTKVPSIISDLFRIEGIDLTSEEIASSIIIAIDKLEMRKN